MNFLRSEVLAAGLIAYGFAGVHAVAAQIKFTDYAMPSSGRVTVPAEGGLTFSMKVNGAGPFATVFDTGAVNVISASLAARLGLQTDERPLDFGAIGGGTRAHTTHVDRLDVGGLIVRDQTFYILDIPSGTGIPQMLVGWEFLQRFAVRMDFRHNELTFYDLRHFVYSGGGTPVPLIFNRHGNGVYLNAEVDGIEGRFQLDSGNQIGLFLNAGFVDKHHLQTALHAALRGYEGKGLGGDAPDAWFTRLHTLRLGSVVLHDPVVRLLTAKDSFQQDLAGNIGQSILKHFTVVVDGRHHVLYLEKLPSWNTREAFNRLGAIYDGQDEGDEVKTVFPGSPAETAGLQRGDLITAVNGAKPTGDPDDPAFTQPAGTVLHLTVRRNGAVQELHVTLRDVL